MSEDPTYTMNGWRLVLVCYDSTPDPKDPEAMVSVMGDEGFSTRRNGDTRHTTCELVTHGSTERLSDAQVDEVFRA